MIFNSDENYKVFLKSCQLNMHPPHLIITYQFQELKVSIFVDFVEIPTIQVQKYFEKKIVEIRFYCNENCKRHPSWEIWNMNDVKAEVVVSTICVIGIWRRNFSPKFFLPTIFQIYCHFSITFLRFVGCIIYSFLFALVLVKGCKSTDSKRKGIYNIGKRDTTRS